LTSRVYLHHQLTLSLSAYSAQVPLLSKPRRLRASSRPTPVLLRLLPVRPSILLSPSFLRLIPSLPLLTYHLQRLTARLTSTADPSSRSLRSLIPDPVHVGSSLPCSPFFFTLPSPKRQCSLNFSFGILHSYQILSSTFPLFLRRILLLPLLGRDHLLLFLVRTIRSQLASQGTGAQGGWVLGAQDLENRGGLVLKREGGEGVASLCFAFLLSLTLFCVLPVQPLAFSSPVFTHSIHTDESPIYILLFHLSLSCLALSRSPFFSLVFQRLSSRLRTSSPPIFYDINPPLIHAFPSSVPFSLSLSFRLFRLFSSSSTRVSFLPITRSVLIV